MNPVLNKKLLCDYNLTTSLTVACSGCEKKETWSLDVSQINSKVFASFIRKGGWIIAKVIGKQQNSIRLEIRCIYSSTRSEKDRRVFTFLLKQTWYRWVSVLLSWFILVLFNFHTQDKNFKCPALISIIIKLFVSFITMSNVKLQFRELLYYLFLWRRCQMSSFDS